ncbi:MAG: FAD-dependent oxidoreductase, partial [Actinomycetota bacterium]
ASVDLAAVQAHLRTVVDGLTSGVEHLLANAGVEVIRGTARFARSNRVVVTAGDGVQHVEFEHAIVATGSRPVELPALPFDGTTVVDSTGALFAFDRVPERMVVVGGGYIGIELGTAWAKLGSAVTLVEAAPSILPGLDARLGRVAARSLVRLGVEVRTGHLAAGWEPGPRGACSLTLERADGTGSETVTADAVVVAVGRRPNTDELGLDVVGVEVDDRGLIPVDGQRRASRNVLAIGDVTDGPALAHKATAEAEVAARTVAGRPASFDPAAIPAVVFADPELATVGLTRAKAEADGVEVTSFVFPISASSRARTLGADGGHIELVADRAGTVLGAHLAGPAVSELVGEAALAIEMAATVEEVAATIHPHPTMSEGLLEAAHGALGLPLHVAGPRRS